MGGCAIRAVTILPGYCNCGSHSATYRADCFSVGQQVCSEVPIGRQQPITARELNLPIPHQYDPDSDCCPGLPPPLPPQPNRQMLPSTCEHPGFLRILCEPNEHIYGT